MCAGPLEPLAGRARGVRLGEPGLRLAAALHVQDQGWVARCGRVGNGLARPGVPRETCARPPSAPFLAVLLQHPAACPPQVTLPAAACASPSTGDRSASPRRRTAAGHKVATSPSTPVRRSRWGGDGWVGCDRRKWNMCCGAHAPSAGIGGLVGA